MKTRSTRNPPSKVADNQAPDTSPNTLQPSSTNPPLLFVLPDDTHPDARILTLPNPAVSGSARYFFCPDKGIYEFTQIAAPKKTPRSWLLAPPRTEKEINNNNVDQDEANTQDTPPFTGYAIQDPDLFVATPLDPLFVLLPALIPNPHETTQLFQSIHDHLDTLAENSNHLRHVIRCESLRRLFEQRANAVCDSVDLGDEKMYRLSTHKLLAELLSKAENMARNGLPASMEAHFVRDALAVPVMTVQREDSSISLTASEEQNEKPSTPLDGESQSAPEPQDSILSTQTGSTTISITTDQTPLSNDDGMAGLLRLRTALNVILSSYIPQTLRTLLHSALSSPESPVDFGPLDAHLDKIALQKREQQALRSLSDNISRKRPGINDEEAEEARAEKKRKKDEEDAKKKNISRGVKQLAKVDTSGMKKLSAFFSKPAPKKTA